MFRQPCGSTLTGQAEAGHDVNRAIQRQFIFLHALKDSDHLSQHATVGIGSPAIASARIGQPLGQLQFLVTVEHRNAAHLLEIQPEHIVRVGIGRVPVRVRGFRPFMFAEPDLMQFVVRTCGRQ